jgi:cellulose synthase/poly-beta-1,6-N-acetylglucosamine synthase-like glycosyltransferase
MTAFDPRIFVSAFSAADSGTARVASPDVYSTSLRRTAGKVFPHLSAWWGIAERCGLTDQQSVRIAAEAERNGTSFAAEAIAQEYVPERDLTRALANELGLRMQGTINPGSLLLPDDRAPALLNCAKSEILVRMNDGEGSRVLLAADQIEYPAPLRTAKSEITARLRLVTPSTLRFALLSRVSQSFVQMATHGLSTTLPAFSARTVANAWQGCALSAVVLALLLGFWFAPVQSLGALHVASTLFFLSCVALRFAATAAGRPKALPPVEKPCPADLPIYSVLVALYKEADVASELVAALRRLDWPASKLDIKFVCEADDRATITALRAAGLAPCMEIVAVPDFGPRTKPKALNYALQVCRGELVALYDAEDRPDPRQLIEAWQRFQSCDASVACLQAPLVITNGNASWIARMFAFEYAALFGALLPWLSRRRLMLPLGGTSNHFRRAALDAVGWWDPYNMTEDADLGVRLARHGFRTETISLPTFEEAPETARIWLPQRTRWLKGWGQTWLVHMRDPVRLYREVGPGSFLLVQVLFAGMLISALVHPILVFTLAYLLFIIVQGQELSTFQSALLTLDATNIACGYMSFWLLGWQAMPRKERRTMWRIVFWTPVYWMMMSYAAWRSVHQLYKAPHLWEKTPHGANAKAKRPAARRPRVRTVQLNGLRP